jgi:hypothetical protein
MSVNTADDQIVEAISQAEVVVNPMVEYVNSLRTQEHGANPSYVYENRKPFLDQLRAGAAWFPNDDALYVRTKLDDLVDDLAADRLASDLIFLTGDAGDGKTALCAQVARRLGRDEELMDVTPVGKWLIVKDASEVEEDRLQALLAERLAQGTDRPRLLVAINEGRLRRVMRFAVTARPGLWEQVIEPALEAWIDDEAARRLDERMTVERVTVLNFRHRFHVPTVVPSLLALWTRPSWWEGSPTCGRCPARPRCPILANATSLRAPVTQSNISDVLASAHFAGQRLPFRRLQAVLAMAVTAGLKCRDVQARAIARAALTPIDLLRYRYYEALLRTDIAGAVSVQPEAITRTLAPADPGRAATWAFDQDVASVVAPDGSNDAGSISLAGTSLPPLEAQAVRFIRSLIQPAEDAREVPDLTRDLARLTQALRRWAGLSADASLSSDAPRPGGRLGEPWRQALHHLREYAGGGRGEDLLRSVVGAINRFHHLGAMKEDAIVRRQIDPAGFRDPRRLALELDLGVDFEVRLARGPVLPKLVGRWLETAASEIYLEARPKSLNAPTGAWARLNLNSRLVEALLSTRAGYTYLGTLGPYRRDLARFHSRLLSLAREAGLIPQVTLRIGSKVYRATSVAPSTAGKASPARLSFDGEV